MGIITFGLRSKLNDLTNCTTRLIGSSKVGQLLNSDPDLKTSLVSEVKTKKRAIITIH